MQISADYVKDLLEYDPLTGLLYWRKYMNSRVPAGHRAGYIDLHGYVVVGLNRKLYKAHRLIWLMQTGSWPKGQIDHINHVRSDNRWLNLSDVSQRINTTKRLISKANTSSHTGVYRTAKGNWIARICVNRTQINLGTYPDINKAIQARKDAELVYKFNTNSGT